MRSSSLYTFLTLTGASPFVACAALPLAGIAELPFLGSLDAVAGSYGLAIVCFLAGTHWATYLLKPAAAPVNLFITSNAVFLAVWFSYVLTGLTTALITQIGAFLYLLFVDYRMRQSGLLPKPYFRIRAIATAVAVASLAVIAVTR